MNTELPGDLRSRLIAGTNNVLAVPFEQNISTLIPLDAGIVLKSGYKLERGYIVLSDYLPKNFLDDARKDVITKYGVYIQSEINFLNSFNNGFSEPKYAFNLNFAKADWEKATAYFSHLLSFYSAEMINTEI